MPFFGAGRLWLRRRRWRCCGGSRRGRGSCLRLPLCLELLVDRGLPPVLRLDELGVDDLLLLAKLVRGGHLLLARRVQIPNLTRQLVLGTPQSADGVVVVRIDDVEHLHVARRLGCTRVVEEQDPQGGATALVRSDGAIARDLLELGDALALLLDAPLQLGDAGLEFLGLLERIEVRTGNLVHLRLRLGDGLVGLGDGVRLLRECRRGGHGKQRSQHATRNYKSGTAPVLRVAPETHRSHLPSRPLLPGSALCPDPALHPEPEVGTPQRYRARSRT